MEPENVNIKVQATIQLFARTYSELPIKDFDLDILSSLSPIHDRLVNFIENPISVEELKNFREILIDEIKGMHTITQFFGLVFDWNFHHLLLYRANDTPIDIPGARDFYDYFDRFVNELEKETGEKDLAYSLKQEFISLIPLRMTTQAYHDAILASLQKIDSYDREHDTLKRLLANWKKLSSMINDSHIKLPASCMVIKQELDKYWQMDTNDDVEKLKEYMDILSNFDDKIEVAVTTILLLFDAVSAALILQQYGDENSIADLKLWIEKDSETLEAAINKSLGALVDMLHEDETPNYDEYEESELDKLFYDSGLEYFGLPSVDENDYNDDNIFDEAIAILTNCVEGLSSRRKRYLRQHFMKNLPFWGDLEKDYKQYFIKSFESLDDFNKKFMLTCSEFFETATSMRYTDE
ncbi:MAG: hypothetical protein FWC91_05470 [Defluviitaleaceae bacterium]|nr:hypothetical protein [Defluviitaleaceae bacterium]